MVAERKSEQEWITGIKTVLARKDHVCDCEHCEYLRINRL